MKFNDTLNEFISGTDRIMLVYAEDTMKISKHINMLPHNTHMIYANECDLWNNPQITMPGDTEICALCKPEMIDIDYADLKNHLAKQVKIILLSSSRKFIYQCSKHADIVYKDFGCDFQYYIKHNQLNLLDQLYMYIVTDRNEIFCRIFSKFKSFEWYMVYNIYSDINTLHNKPIMEVSTCFNAPYKHISIIYALANGCRNSGDVSKFLNMKQTTVSKYLLQLQNYGFIEYITPLGAPENSKGGKYHIVSPYHHFWFRFLYINMYTFGNLKAVKKDLAENRDSYLVQNHLTTYMQYIINTKYPDKEISFAEWWNSDFHIDTIGVCEVAKTLYLGKYYDKVVSYSDFTELMSASGKIKGYEQWKKIFIVFSSAGFETELKLVSDANEHIILQDISFDKSE